MNIASYYDLVLLLTHVSNVMLNILSQIILILFRYPSFCLYLEKNTDTGVHYPIRCGLIAFYGFQVVQSIVLDSFIHTRTT